MWRKGCSKSAQLKDRIKQIYNLNRLFLINSAVPRERIAPVSLNEKKPTAESAISAVQTGENVCAAGRLVRTVSEELLLFTIRTYVYNV